MPKKANGNPVKAEKPKLKVCFFSWVLYSWWGAGLSGSIFFWKVFKIFEFHGVFAFSKLPSS